MIWRRSLGANVPKTALNSFDGEENFGSQSLAERVVAIKLPKKWTLGDHDFEMKRQVSNIN